MKKLFIAAAAFIAMSAGTASASLIVGEIGFFGMFTPNSTPLSTATSLTFPLVQVLGSTGDLVAVTPGAITFNGFAFSPGLSPNPVVLWEKDGFSFEMDSVIVDQQTDAVLQLYGEGTVKGAGFDDTDGVFVFNATTGGSIFTFSANVSIPEPTSVMVWSGLAMAGIVARRRRRS